MKKIVVCEMNGVKMGVSHMESIKKL